MRTVEPPALNSLDRKIIDILLNSSKDSSREIADQIGSSASSVWRRVQKLESDGVISKNKISLNYEKIGFTETFFLILSLDEAVHHGHEKFRQFAQKCENIVQCHLITGEFDYLLMVVTSNMSEYADIVEGLRKQKFLKKTLTLGALKSIKNDPSGLINVL